MYNNISGAARRLFEQLLFFVVIITFRIVCLNDYSGEVIYVQTFISGRADTDGKIHTAAGTSQTL